jgi:hypothetical protein
MSDVNLASGATIRNQKHANGNGDIGGSTGNQGDGFGLQKLTPQEEYDKILPP